MSLSKKDTQSAKGIAITGMVMLHLFCRLDNLPYTPLISIGNVPLMFYFGLFGDICVPIFCFCSGYAHYLIHEKQGSLYKKRIPGKILRFLLNYWMILLPFALLGLIFDKAGTIPGSFSKFAGNFFLYRISYNGAWWFVVTYLFLLLLSPLTSKIIKKFPAFVILTLSGIIYTVSYLFRFKYGTDISSPLLSWLWSQLILLGTSQFGYITGMLFYKYSLIEKFQNLLFKIHLPEWFKTILISLLPASAFVCHCFVQSLFFAPFTALAVLVWLFLIKKPAWLENALAFLGRHSTNIWLMHMFFYMAPFENFVFCVKYAVPSLLLMFGVCMAVSLAINALYTPLCRQIDRFGKKLSKSC